MEQPGKGTQLTFWAIYCVLDIIAVGMGMGVPAGAIILGFPFGWILVRRRHEGGRAEMHPAMRAAFRDSVIAAAFTLVIMLAIWGPTARLLFDPEFDIAEFGHPFWLYDPLISYIGWLVLMIVVSPILQLLTAVFASYVALMTDAGHRTAEE